MDAALRRLLGKGDRDQLARHTPTAPFDAWRPDRDRRGPAGRAARSVLVDDGLGVVADVVGCVLPVALGPIDLAFVLEALVAGQIAGGFLHAALGLVGLAVSHVSLLGGSVSRRWPTRRAPVAVVAGRLYDALGCARRRVGT